ncbi:MAG: acetylxylan esterase, partial [Planctomycetes bacterium]|nr:acetylxylan esterase [Planctomycetota bacterium]
MHTLLAQEPPFYPDHSKLLVYRDAAGAERPVKTAADWAKRRAHILANMQLVMGSLPDASPPRRIDVQVTEEVALAKFVRKKITFASEKDDRVPAYLFIPQSAIRNPKCPAVLCLHQTTKIGKGEPSGLGGLANLHYALELAERGYVTLA